MARVTHAVQCVRYLFIVFQRASIALGTITLLSSASLYKFFPSIILAAVTKALKKWHSVKLSRRHHTIFIRTTSTVTFQLPLPLSLTDLLKMAFQSGYLSTFSESDEHIRRRRRIDLLIVSHNVLYHPGLLTPV